MAPSNESDATTTRSSQVDVGLVAAVAAFFITRAWLLLAFTPWFTDAWLYWEYAYNTVDRGLIAYSEAPPDRVLEYPPLAFEALTVPRRLASDTLEPSHLDEATTRRVILEYLDAFRWEMAAFDLLAFLLFIAIARLRRPEFAALAAWGYVLTTAVLAHVLHTRLDAPMSALVLAWAWAWFRSERATRGASLWRILGYTAIGLGVSFKLIPLVLFPLTFLADLRRARIARSYGSVAAGIAAFATAAILPFAWHYARAGSAVFALFKFHGSRPIEIESLGATLLMPLGLLGLRLGTVMSYGSINLTTPGTPAASLMTQLMTAVGALTALAVGISALIHWRALTFTRAYQNSLWLLAALTILSKVLSTQYFVWLAPITLLLGLEVLSRRAYVALLLAQLLVVVLTTAVFPYMFFSDYADGSLNPFPLTPLLHWLPCTLLVLRNAIELACVIWLGWKIRTAARADRFADRHGFESAPA